MIETKVFDDREEGHLEVGVGLTVPVAELGEELQ